MCEDPSLTLSSSLLSAFRGTEQSLACHADHDHVRMQVQGLQQQLTAARLQDATAAAHSPEPASGLSTAASTPAKAGSQVSGQASEATSGQPEHQEASQKDLQIAEFKQRLVKAKRQLVSWKQQVADATAARDEALGQLQAAQAQLEEQQEAGPDADVEGLRAQLAEVSAASNVAAERLQVVQVQLAQQQQEAAAVDPCCEGPASSAGRCHCCQGGGPGPASGCAGPA